MEKIKGLLIIILGCILVGSAFIIAGFHWQELAICALIFSGIPAIGYGAFCIFGKEDGDEKD